MSKTKLPYFDALTLAEDIVSQLSPACERIKIAGSVRRKKSEVGDIEIVAIPRYIKVPNLFGETQLVSVLDDVLPFMDWQRIKGGDKYKQYNIGLCNLDLFIATPENWGVIYTIRTGSADFSHWLVTPKRMGGACPGYLRFKDGRIWHGEIAIETRSEEDVFKALGIAWIEPEHRCEERRSMWDRPRAGWEDNKEQQ